MSEYRSAGARLCALILGLCLGTPAGFAAPPPTTGQHAAAIKLQTATFRPGLGESPALPKGLTIAAYARDQQGYYLVQFAGPVKPEWKADVEAAGAELLHYIPDFAFKVRMNPVEAMQVSQLESVGWVGLFQPAYKLSPNLALDGTKLYRVRIERGADAGLTRAAVLRSGATFVRGSGSSLVVLADAAQVEAIAHVLDVAWIENFRFPERHNEYGAGVIMGANTANTTGYDGSTQTIAVADTGLGDGTSGGAHPSLTGRVVAIHDWPGSNGPRCYKVVNDGARDVDSGHGTHTAVSTAGAGNNAGEGKGTAPAAGLVFQAVEDYADMIRSCSALYPDGYYLLGLPDDIRAAYQQAYNDGARIHSNSWGSDAAGSYTVDSANSDDFIWNHPDMVITFSAGNAGVDGNNNGVVDSDSTGSPATAKNVITVGASENDRNGNWDCDSNLSYTQCAAQGGQNVPFTYGAAWPADYPAEPLKSDPSAGNAQQMAAFSSRGPTDDGRIKPDVVAPGTWVLSGYASLYQQEYDGAPNPQNGLYQYDGWGYPLDGEYKYMGGTSMSNPLVAGAAAVTRDFYQKKHGHAASAALVKATLINSAVDLLDENNDGANDNDFPIPNIHEGWGRVDLGAAVDDSHVYQDETTGLNTGATSSYQYTVASPGTLKITLVWSDYPSTESASVNLVNDLDLVVTSPGGAIYRGNQFSGGWSTTGGTADRRNNVENVYVASAQAGAWTVQVSGYNVAQGSQPFALVVDGADNGTQPVNQTPSITLRAPAEGATVSGDNVLVQIDASDPEETTAGSLTVQWNVDGSSWSDALYNGSNGYYEASWDTTNASEGGHTVNVRVEDADKATASDAHDVTVDNVTDPGPVDIHVGDLDDASTSASRGRWNAGVTVTVHDSVHAGIAGVTVSGDWSVNGSGSCTTNGSGQCTVTKNNLKSNVGSVTFTVSDITDTGGSYVYASGSNHDPEGDSNGTLILLSQP